MKQVDDTLPMVNVVGLGVRGRKQITLESLNIIRNSSFVLYFPIEHKLHNWLIEYLDVKNLESLESLYRHGDIDIENYMRITDKIINISKEFGDVTVLLPGHPYVGVTWIKMLNKLASDEVIRLNIFDGISSFDTMITDLKIDPLDHGATIIDANRLLLYKLKIEPKIDLFIYHICSVGNSKTEFNNITQNNHLNSLQVYLENYFTLNHKVVLIGSNSNSNNGLIIECKLKDLNTLANDINVATSLYIPGLDTSLDDIDKTFHNMLRNTK